MRQPSWSCASHDRRLHRGPDPERIAKPRGIGFTAFLCLGLLFTAGTPASALPIREGCIWLEGDLYLCPSYGGGLEICTDWGLDIGHLSCFPLSGPRLRPAPFCETRPFAPRCREQSGTPGNGGPGQTPPQPQPPVVAPPVPPTPPDLPIGRALGLGPASAVASVSWGPNSSGAPPRVALELVPVLVRDRRWTGTTELFGHFPGWPPERMRAELEQARSFWARVGVEIQVAPVRGPILVDDSNIPRDQPGAGKRMREFIEGAGITSLPPNRVPVVFIRTIEGTVRIGRSFVGSHREPAAIAIGMGASRLTLTHEVGHVLGLEHSLLPLNLMFPTAVFAHLWAGQIATARDVVRIRSSSR